MSKIQPANATQKCFLEGTYSYRQWPAILVLGAIGSVDIVIIAGLIASPRQLIPAPDKIFGIIAGSLWLISTSVVVSLCAWRMTFRPLVDTRIDTLGIQIDDKTTPWESVRAIYGQRVGELWRSDRLSLHYLIRGRLPWSLIRHVPINPLTQDEYRDLMDQLGSFLGKKHPRVNVG